MHRIRGRGLKYALWAMSNEVCVVIGENVVTAATRRLVYHKIGQLVEQGFATNDGQLTDLGKSLVPTSLSPSAHAKALKFFVPGVKYFYNDQHVLRADGSPGHTSRYIAEMLLAKGVLIKDDKGYIVRDEVGPKMSWKYALWTLSNEPCYVENNALRAKSDGRVVFEDALVLEQNGCMDRNAQITDFGRRMVPKRMGESTIKAALSVFSGRWQYQGNFAVGENGGRLPRYTVERLVAIGKLQINVDGYIVKPEERQRIQLDVTASELEAIRRCTTSTVTLIKRPVTA